MQSEEAFWYVYILQCENDSFYVGISTNVHQRFLMHQSERGAVFTRKFSPVSILWQEKHNSRASAHRRERQIKGWSRVKKKALISGII